MPSRRFRFALVLLLIAVASLAPRREVAAEGLTVKVDAKLEVSPVGDREARIEIAWGAEVYPRVKEKFPDPRKFLQDMAPDRAAYEMKDASATYDDAKTAVVLRMTELAAAANRGDGRWELEPEPTATFDRASPAGAERPTVWLKTKGDWGEGLHYEGSFVCALPAGATEVRWDEATKVLSYRLATPASTGPPRLTADLRVRDRVMSTVYKVYGLESDRHAFWLAKTVFRNEGKGVARRLKIRYRLQDYGDWSPWEKHAEVLPGQTIVSANYPVLAASIARLKTNTPANLLMEYVYEDDTGRRIEDDDAKKTVILGVNEFVFGNLAAGQSFGTWQEDYNNATLLAAWVSRNDGAIKQFAAMANRMAGGVGASTDDASAMRVLKSCYELLQNNDFTYQHPPALKDRTVSFDPHDVQAVKFPRDTLRDRSGTCIDLAILYAAMVNAVGLEPHLVLVPGHCFPLVKLPSGRIVGVETTGVQGGLRVGSAPFSRVQQFADQEYERAQKDGRIYEIDVRALWTSGISNPELEDLPPDILERWGISEEGRGRKPKAPDDVPAAAPATGDLDAAVGLWGGAIGHKDGGVTVDSFVLAIDKKGEGYEAATRADVTVSGGAAEKKVVVITEYVGEAKGDALVFRSTSRKRTVDGGAEETLTQASLRVVPKKGSVAARVGNDAEGYTDFTLVPKTREETAAPSPVRGEWGGEMPHAKLSENVILDEMYVSVPATGAYAADVRMECTVLVKDEKVPVTVVASYRDGKVDGDRVRFAIVPWHRTVPSSGKKDELEGNPLVLHVTAEGKLSGQFEGEDGWPFTLLRREGTPAPTPGPAGLGPDDLRFFAGAWGGDFGDAKLNEELSIRTGNLDLANAGGRWTATVDMKFVVHTPSGDVLVGVAGTYPPGKVEGDAIKFPGTSLTRTIVSSGATNAMDGNPLEIRRESDGVRIEAKFVGEGGFTLSMKRR